MAGKYGPDDISITLEDSPGGTARNVENFLLNGFSAKDISEMVDTTALGDAWREQTPTGLQSGENMSLEGIWDTTGSTGSHAVFGTIDNGPQDDGREIIITFGDSKTWTRDVRIAEYEIILSVDDIQRFRALLVPTGSAAWA